MATSSDAAESACMLVTFTVSYGVGVTNADARRYSGAGFGWRADS